MRVFRSPVCGPARLHWGKAGWDTDVAGCFDGAAEYPETVRTTLADHFCCRHLLEILPASLLHLLPLLPRAVATVVAPQWCSFGCAAAQLDPRAKFAGAAGAAIWSWAATDALTGASISDFAGTCCGAAGFDTGRCTCARRRDCS